MHDATHHIDDAGCVECQRREHVVDGPCWCAHGPFAAAARPAPDGPQGMTTRQTLDGSPRPAAPEAAPEVSAPALGRRLPASDAASAAAAPDELTLRALWGDK